MCHPLRVQDFCKIPIDFGKIWEICWGICGLFWLLSGILLISFLDGLLDFAHCFGCLEVIWDVRIFASGWRFGSGI